MTKQNEEVINEEINILLFGIPECPAGPNRFPELLYALTPNSGLISKTYLVAYQLAKVI